MLTCERCRVTIRGEQEICPLCGGALEGEAEDPAFPVLPQRKVPSDLVFKGAVFCFCALVVVMLTLRYLLGPEAVWTTAVILWAPLGLAAVFITMAYRHSVLKLISAEVYSAMVINFLIDRRTGWHGWSVAFVIPALFLVLILGTLLAAAILKLKRGEYLIYLIIGEVLSFVQVIFLLLKMNPYPPFAVVEMALMLILIMGEFIFLFQDFRSTTGKTLHL